MHKENQEKFKLKIKEENRSINQKSKKSTTNNFKMFYKTRAKVITLFDGYNLRLNKK